MLKQIKIKLDVDDIFFYYDTRKKTYGAIVDFCGEPVILDGRK